MTKVLYFQSPDGEYIMTQGQYNKIRRGNFEKDNEQFIAHRLILLAWDWVKENATKVSDKVKPSNNEWWMSKSDIQLIELGNKNQHSLFEAAND